MTNVPVLKYEIQKSGLKMGHIAEKLGIRLGTFSRKVNGKAEFTGTEIQRLSMILGFTNAQRDHIFFGDG